MVSQLPGRHPKHLRELRPLRGGAVIVRRQPRRQQRLQLLVDQHRTAAGAGHRDDLGPGVRCLVAHLGDGLPQLLVPAARILRRRA